MAINVAAIKAKNQAANAAKAAAALPAKAVTPTGSVVTPGNGFGGQASTPNTSTPVAQNTSATVAKNPNALGSLGAKIWNANQIKKTTKVQSPVTPTVGLPQKTVTPPVSFGGAAMQQNTTSPNYLETRNTGLASDYSKLGLKDANGVYQELSKNADFASASEVDKQNTANAIFTKMGKAAAGQTAQTEVKTDDIGKDTKEYATLTDAEQDNPWISTLSEVEKQAYSMMSETEKKQFINIGRNDLKNTSTYVARWKEQRDFNKQQGDFANQQAKLQNENAAIADNQRIRQAKQQLGNLEKNIGYLGTMGSPGVSATKMTAIKDQYTEAEKVFTELQTMAKNQEELRKLGMDELASKLDFQMKGLQDDLDDKVSKAMQESLAGLSAADIKNQLDTVEEIDAFRKNLITNLDSKIGGFMDDNIKARAFLIERFDVLAKDMRDQANKKTEADTLYTKNANTVNVDMSTAQGFFVDGNGQPIISATTGQVIPMPKKPPMEPIFKDGQLITFTSGENGELIPHVQQVSKPEGKIQTIVTTDEFGNKVEQSVITTQNPDGSLSYKPVTFGGGATGTTGGGEVNPESGTPVTGSAVAPTLAANPANITQIADNMEPGKAYDCGTRGQCGQWWNDAIGKSNGTKVADDYASKKKFADKSIAEGQPGMGVVFNLGGAYEENGHIGMLASGLETNNGMKGYRVVSANYGGDEKLSKDFIAEALIKSNGGFVPTKATAAGNKEYDTARYPQYREYIEDGKLPAGMKDNTRQASIFRQEALNGYTQGKNSLLQKSGLSISDDKAYMSTTVDQRKAVDKAVQNINPFITTMDKLIELTKKYGNESTATSAGKEMEQLARNAQLLAKEIYNLGVLNGPDLELMQSIIANPTNATGIGNPLLNHAKMLEKGKKTILDNAYSMAATVGIKPSKTDNATGAAGLQAPSGSKSRLEK